MTPAALETVSNAILPARDLAVAINEAHTAACRAALGALEHARRCGELLCEQKGQLLHGQWLPWLSEHCPDVTPQTAQRYMRIATRWTELEGVNTSRVTHLSVRDALQMLADKTPRVARNTGDCEWYTPREILDHARDVLGQIDLDPASTPAANAIVQAQTFFTLDDDGLAQEWQGTVWLNPPYSHPLVDRFCQKLAASMQSGTVSAAIVLINNCTETKWFATLTRDASALCFPTGRVHFWKPDRVTDAPLQGQALVYCGADVDQFCRVFARLSARSLRFGEWARRMSELHADIRWDQTPVPWSDSAPLLDLAAEMILTIEDDAIADLVEGLALLIVERDEQITATQEVVSVAICELRGARSQNLRLRDRLLELRETLRRRSAS